MEKINYFVLSDNDTIFREHVAVAYKRDEKTIKVFWLNDNEQGKETAKQLCEICNDKVGSIPLPSDELLTILAEFINKSIDPIRIETPEELELTKKAIQKICFQARKERIIERCNELKILSIDIN